MPSKTVTTGGGTKVVVLSRIGLRRQVVIPKRIFDQLELCEGDFLEITAEAGRVSMRPKKLVDASNILTADEAKKARHGLKQAKSGKVRPWDQIKHELDL